MVEFVYGVPGSGKTSYIMSRLLADVRSGRRAFLIVPEQQTVDVERTIAGQLPPSAQLYIEALNFSRLANRVFRERGGLVYNYADKSRKQLFMWRAIRECSPFLTEYSGRATDSSLPSAMLDSVREFKNCGVTPEALSDAARKLSAGDGSDRALGKKLTDLSLVYAAYDALLGQNYTDSDDDLSRLAEKLAEAPYFTGTAVYIDSFSSFTKQEHEIIRLIMRQAEETLITLPLDSPRDRALCALSSKKCSDRIRRDASALGITPQIICLGENRRAGNKELRAVCEQFHDMSKTAEIPTQARGHIELYSLCDTYSECDAAAARVKALIMDGYRCRDIAIIARDAEKYRGIIDPALEKLDIPYFLSEKTGFSTRPLARLILSALRIKIYGWRRSDVIAHLKTGLCGISARDIDIFEAYAEKWNINGRSFYSEENWNMNPDGYVTHQSVRGAEILTTANRVRILLRDRLIPLFASIEAADDTAGICRALWEYLDALNVRETLRELAAREISEGRRREAEENIRLYDSAADALECLCDVFDGKPDLATFAAALRIAFDSAEIGTIPTGCDEVMIGSANMLRAGERKCALIIGLNEGEFPHNTARGGLITDRERETLAAMKLDLSGGMDEAASDELFYLLRAISVPSERLLVFMHEADASGSSCRPSSAFLRLSLILPHIKVKTEKDLLPEDRIWSKRTALEYISMYSGTPVGDAIRRCLGNDAGSAISGNDVLLPLSARREAVPAELAREVFGERIELTQSKLESFVGCPCGYYLKYILRLDENARAEFGYAGMGSFVHRVLERFLLTVASDGGFDCPPDEEKAARILDRIVADYISLLGADTVSPRIKYRINRMRRVTELLISDIFAEFSSGTFRPAALELPIGMSADGRGIPAAEFPLPDGGSALLRGIADRVDTAIDPVSGQTLVRVVDYKTGSKDFSIEEMHRGFDLQLPIYLYSITRYGNSGKDERFGKAPVPAAITYLSSNVPAVMLERPVSPEDVRQKARQSIRRSGLVIDRSEVLNALSAERDPHFMQGAKYSRDGTPSAALLPPDGMEQLFSELENTVSRIAGDMRSGRACASPQVGSSGKIVCGSCPYAAVCRAALKSN